MKNIFTRIVMILSVLFCLLLLSDTDLFVYPFLSDAYSLHLYAVGLLVLLFLGLLFRGKIITNYPPLN